MKFLTDAIRDRAADAMLAMIPLYYKNVIRKKYTGNGMLIAEYHTLGILKRHGELPMSELGNRLYISKPYMTRLADVMIADGLVERHNDENDRRVINLAITAKGKKFLKDAVLAYKSDLVHDLKSLDEEEAGKLALALEESFTILSKLTGGDGT